MYKSKYRKYRRASLLKDRVAEPDGGDPDPDSYRAFEKKTGTGSELQEKQPAAPD